MEGMDARKTTLCPNNKFKTKIRLSILVAKIAYNYALDKIEEFESRGIEEELREFCNDTSVRKMFNEEKKYLVNIMVADKVSCDIPKQAIKDAFRAYDNYKRHLAEYPVRKDVDKVEGSFYVDSYKIKFNENKVLIPRIGWVKISEQFKHQLPKEIKNIRVSFDGINYNISYAYPIELPPLPIIDNMTLEEIEKSTLGNDVGIKVAVTSSDGSEIKLNKKHIYKIDKRIDKLNKLCDKHRKEIGAYKNGSINHQRREAELRKLHKKKANIVSHNIYLSANILLNKGYTILVLENLDVKAMMKDKKFARSLAIASFGRFGRVVEYKARRMGIITIRADQYYASTQTCSNCGHQLTKEQKLKIYNRTYVCPECSFVCNRDLNASFNLKQYVLNICSDAPESKRVESSLKESMKHEDCFKLEHSV